jgi:hypothetical protein
MSVVTAAIVTPERLSVEMPVGESDRRSPGDLAYCRADALRVPYGRLLLFRCFAGRRLPAFLQLGRERDRHGRQLRDRQRGPDAIVMAWLPGSEGAGVTDVLFGDVRPRASCR